MPKGVYHAPSYYRFEDSPLFFSPSHITFELQAAGRPLGVTVYGAIGNCLKEPVMMLGSSTNSAEFQKFLQLVVEQF